MYLELFNLRELPFRLSPDPQFLYLSKGHARAKAYMESTIWFTDGFVVITGEIGSGKTTLIETFLKELGKDVVVAQINQTQVSTLEFLQTLLVQFGFSPFKMKKAELLATLNEFLIEQYANGRKVLLIVDEAQNLSPRVLEEIRMLSGVETTKEKVLRIILAGQPELNVKLDAPELVQLTQRVRLRFHLARLSPEDTAAYILHRLEVAGSHGRQIFAPESFDTIFRYTGGTPRLINTLCDTAMLAAFGRESDTVSMADVEAAIAELQWHPFGDTAASAAAAPGRTAPAVRARPSPPSDDITGTEPVLGDEAYGEATQDHVNPGVQSLGPAVSPSAGPPLAHILLAQGARTLFEHALHPGRFLIGRTLNNDLQIDSKYISRHHCQIITTPTGCTIEDLNSRNGIFIKSKRVRQHHLNDGDVVTIGQHELLYIDDRPHHEEG